ncbi:MAG: hypothetical protein LBJ00_13670 [Planctomycetaceae bacterium]|nr:hypothetical protein [Planctomycetaceae bacterium]
MVDFEEAYRPTGYGITGYRFSGMCRLIRNGSDDRYFFSHSVFRRNKNETETKQIFAP